MSDKESEETPRPLVCPTCARPFEDEKPARPLEDEEHARLDSDRYRTDGRGLTWIRLGGMELE